MCVLLVLLLLCVCVIVVVVVFVLFLGVTKFKPLDIKAVGAVQRAIGRQT